MAKSLREAIEILERKGLVIRIHDSVSKMHEIPSLMQELESRFAVFFENIEGYEEFRLISGIYGDRRRLSVTLGLKDEREIYDALNNAIKNPISPKKESVDFDINLVNEEVDLRKIPIPTFYEKDKGPYITAGIVIAKDIDSGARNASYHRMTPISKNRLVMRVVERDLWAFIMRAREAGKNLDAAVVIGVDPATAIAAATTLPIYEDELEVANSLLSGELSVTNGLKTNVEYPSNAEIVLEGEIITDALEEEGPFVDITGTYDTIRKQPVFKVHAIRMKNKPIFHAILPAGSEHKTLMGLPREAKIFNLVKEVTVLKDVYLTDWGCGWLECVMSIKKRHKDEPINAGMAAITAHPSVKKVIVVDDDINIRDCKEVYWAVITRSNPAKDYVIIPRAKGSTLDHSGEPRSKIIIDATIKGERSLFEKGVIPRNSRVKEILKKLKR